MGNNDALKEIKPKFEPGAPKIKYPQLEGERTCLINSVCNTLYFLNFKEAAAKIWRNRNIVLAEEEPSKRWTAMHKLVEEHTGILYPRKVQGQVGEPLFRLDLYREDTPLIVALEGSDGKIDHVIGLANSYIFDGSFEYALITNKKIWIYAVLPVLYLLII